MWGAVSIHPGGVQGERFERSFSDAGAGGSGQGGAMTTPISLPADEAWAAFERRDRAYDGRFVVGVTTTRIVCRPSCPARRPKRENTELLADMEAAERRGLRPCLRCRPEAVARDRVAVERVAELIGRSPERVALAELASAVGYSPAHLQRLFTRVTGVSPAAYGRALRAERAAAALGEAASVTDAIGAAGHDSAAGFYAEAPDRLGMTPTAWRDGGRGVAIRWTEVATTLGPLMVAATPRGLCRVAFDTGPGDLHERFPNAGIDRDDGALADLAARAVAVVERPGRAHDLPLDVAGTAFQQAVWQELARVPAGETVSYAALAARAGTPGAARAAGTACGANAVAVLIPCHRAVRADGSLGGYAWGLDVKRELLKRESGE